MSGIPHDLTPELAAFVDHVAASYEIETPFGGRSSDYRLLATVLKGRILGLERAGRAADQERELHAKMEEMAERAESNERARALLDALTDPHRREQYLLEEGLCLDCQGMGTRATPVAGAFGGREAAACPGCGGSGKYRDYQDRQKRRL